MPPPQLRAAAALLLAGAGAGVALAANNIATSVLLTDAVTTHGARCLDGSPQRYWIELSDGGADASKWVLDFMGGAWCESIADCSSRAYGEMCFLGSSAEACTLTESPNDGTGAPFNQTMDWNDIPSCLGSRWCGGLFNNDTARNPLSAGWNKVLISYCSGDSYAGSNASVTYTTAPNGTANVPLYFRGLNNRRAVIDDLVATYGMGSATDVIVTGNSAGGLAVYFGIDDIASMLPGVNVYGVPDSGFFLTDPSFPAWSETLTWIAEGPMNATGGLNQKCVAAMNAQGGSAASCAFVEIGSSYVETPLFAMNGVYDPALVGISFGGGNASRINEIGAKVASNIFGSVLSRPGNAAFLTGCAEHCGQWAQGKTGKFADFNVTIDGFQAVEAVAEWLAGGPRNVWVQGATYPCSTCCSGGSSESSSAAAPQPPSTPSPPCYSPLNPAYETLCFTTQASAGNVSVRVIGAGVDGVLVTGMSANTSFAAGSVASATPVFEYFLSDNDEFVKVPLTVPLIFRPDPAGTWLASFALPTSVYASEAKAPGIVPGMDALFEEFAPGGARGAGRTVAALTFYTIELATAADYTAACASLAAALPGMGLAPVSGAWREAWVTFSTQAVVGDMVNECWIEVASSAAH